MRKLVLGLNSKNEILVYTESDGKNIPQLQQTYPFLEFVTTEYSGRLVGKMWDPIHETIIDHPRYTEEPND